MVVSFTDGAPEAALWLEVAPLVVVLAPTKLTMSIEPWYPEPWYPPAPRVAVTVTFLRAVVATACQISTSPAWELDRWRSVQVKPAPVTPEKACEPPRAGPSLPRNATTSSLGRVVEKDGDVMLAALLLACVDTSTSIEMGTDALAADPSDSKPATVRTATKTTSGPTVFTLTMDHQQGGSDRRPTPGETPSNRSCPNACPHPFPRGRHCFPGWADVARACSPNASTSNRPFPRPRCPSAKLGEGAARVRADVNPQVLVRTCLALWHEQIRAASMNGAARKLDRGTSSGIRAA